MRIILQSADDILRQARAAEIALTEFPGNSKQAVIGVEVDGGWFGIRWNKDSVSVYPQPRAATAEPEERA